MKGFFRVYTREPLLLIIAAALILVSIISLNSMSPTLFPTYYLYILVGIIIFIIFSHLDFEILSIFYIQLYVISVIFLFAPLVIGQITRGTIRWIPLGALNIQPAEIVKPFLVIFFATFLTKKRINLKRFLQVSLLFFIPFALIAVQPSLGVAILTLAGFIGVILSLDFDKRLLIVGVLVLLVSAPVLWNFLAPYQKQRIESLISPQQDPLGEGYHRVQSIITVGSGRFFGRGLGGGVQTQLSFLPERHTDFIFASISEEMGMLGALIVTILSFLLLYRITHILSDSESIIARSFASGIFLLFFVQIITHIGMNLGLMPITGLPLPLVSAGGSSFLSTMITLGILINLKK